MTYLLVGVIPEFTHSLTPEHLSWPISAEFIFKVALSESNDSKRPQNVKYTAALEIYFRMTHIRHNYLD